MVKNFTQKKFSVHLLFFCSLLLIPPVCEAQLIDSESLKHTLDSLASANLFSGAMLVGIDSSVEFYHSAGFSKRNPDKHFTDSTKFELASLTKQFTASLILKLFEQGKLDLHDPFGNFLKWYPNDYKDSVTVHQLLSHQSGIPNYTNLSDWPSLSVKSFDKKEFVNLFAYEPPELNPGTGFSYSNSNYYLLGLIAEEVMQKSYKELLREYIFVPLEMNQSGTLFKRDDIICCVAMGYEKLPNGKVERAPRQDYSTAFSVSGIYSTPTDLFKWSQALTNYSILKDTIMRNMLTPYANGYGYGLLISRVSPEKISVFLENPFADYHENQTNQDLKIVWHWGSNPGYNTLLLIVPDLQATIIILENMTRLNSEKPTEIYALAEQVILEIMN